MKQEQKVTVNRTYKDRLFRMIFDSPEKVLTLYNAVNGTSYTSAKDLEIVTLENALYMNMKNDLAFVVDCRLNLYEHQSTVNPNMPLRNLFYVTSEYEVLISKKSLYVSRLVKIPTPKFVVFYNGTREQPEQQILKLSDAFEIPEEQPDLELKVTIYNINYGEHPRILEQCQLLKEYMQYVDRVRAYHKEMSIEEAVKRAVEDCIAEGILAEFLTRYKSEVTSVSIFEYDEEREIALIREDEFMQGVERGIEQGITQGIEQGIEQGIHACMEICRELQLPEEEIVQKLMEKFNLDQRTAENYIKKQESKIAEEANEVSEN